MRRALAITTLAATAVVGLGTGTALAHGEQTQEPFVRASTVVIHDVAFSGDELDLGEELVVTGRLRIMEAWPDHTIEEPEVGFLSLVTPGPVLAITDRRMNGTFTPQSVHIQKGATYEFEVRAVGRVPGRYHIHPSFSVEGVGTLAGEGIWVTVTEAGAYTDEVELANGEVIDLTSHGLGRVAGWHAVSLLVGLLWLGYWLRKPLIARAHEVDEGRGGSLVTATDRTVAVGAGVLVVVVLAAGQAVTAATVDGPLLPLQVARVEPAPSVLAEPFVDSTITRAAWQADDRRMEVVVEVTNNGTSPVTLTRLQVAEFELQQHTVVTPSAPIAPGASTELVLRIDGDRLEEWNLLPLRDPQLRFTALLFFTDAQGNETVSEVDEVSAPVLPL